MIKLNSEIVRCTSLSRLWFSLARWPSVSAVGVAITFPKDYGSAPDFPIHEWHPNSFDRRSSPGLNLYCWFLELIGSQSLSRQLIDKMIRRMSYDARLANGLKNYTSQFIKYHLSCSFRHGFSLIFFRRTRYGENDEALHIIGCVYVVKGFGAIILRNWTTDKWTG